MTIARSLVTVPCLKDNYAFLFRAGGRTVCVDVPEAAPIRQALAERGWTLTDILLTHHHDDHIAGVADLVEAHGAKVWGADADAHRLPPLDHAVAPGDEVVIGPETARVWDVSGHTMGHVAYVFDDVAFTGDSLMAAGCGRLFEGDAATMHASLSRFDDLPDETLIASGHEYTANNLAFALSLEPDNPALTSRMSETEAARERGEATVPSALGLERHTNPFLRVRDPALKAATGTTGQSDSDTFAAARHAKDAF